MRAEPVEGITNAPQRRARDRLRLRQVTARDEETRSRAQRWFENAITAWETEGRVTDEEATNLRQQLAEPQFLAVLPHFGVHLTIGVFLRFPIGSITRASYTLLNLLAATLLFLIRRIHWQRWRQYVSIHSPLVVLIAAMPGIGTFAYLASGPIRANHLLLRVGLDAVLLKLPWRVYERTGLRWVNARPRNIAFDELKTDRLPLHLTIWAQSIVLVLGCIAVALFAADILTQLAHAILAPDVPGWVQARRILDLGAEQSLGTWFVVVSLVLLSALLAVVGFVQAREGDGFVKHWFVLAFLALAFSLDEQAKFHDPGGGTAELRERLDLSGPIYFGWVIFGLLSVTVVAVMYRRFASTLPQVTRRLYMLAAGLFVAGEIGFEMLAGWYVDATSQVTGEEDLIYQTLASFEEFLGMAGVVVAIAATLHYLQHYIGEVHVSLSDQTLSSNNHTHALARAEIASSVVDASRTPQATGEALREVSNNGTVSPAIEKSHVIESEVK